MQKITKYFRNAVAASSQGTHEYKDNDFRTISFKELEEGYIGDDTLNFLWEDKKEQDIDTADESKGNIKNVMIALKTVSSEFEDSEKTENNIEEMLSIFFLPVSINRRGQLIPPDEGKMPWIPREYLNPMEDPQIAVGDSDKYDEYLEITTDKRNQIDSWNKYFEYAIKMYEYVANAKFADQYICNENQKIKFDGKYYLFLDITVNASFHIMQLYNDLQKNADNKLYKKLTDGKQEPARKLFLNTNIDKMKKHVGQMSGEYPLSPSQREAINHFDEIKEGDILAVSGPPGTGKTTLLQSVVANMYVEAALKKAEAPIIVAASTNNQAVTNIIDSFGKIKVIGISNLEKKWISGTNSFATYFPSKGKMKEAKDNNYQYTTVIGGAFLDQLESSENREAAKESFKQEYSNYLKEDATDFSICSNTIWKKLDELNTERVDCCCKIEDIKKILGEDSYGTYVSKLQTDKQEKEKEKKNIQQNIEDIKNKNQRYLGRCNEWRDSYNKLSWYVRLIKFLPYFRNKISAWSFSFIDNEELRFLRRDMKMEEIENIYHRMITENDKKTVKFMDSENMVDKEISEIEGKLLKIEGKLSALKANIQTFEEYQIMLLEEKANIDWNPFDVCEMNNLLDRVRYAEFWLAVHYYESRWLLEKNPISEKQKGTTFEGVLDKMYHRLAMISPCMVMTFFMLPKQFRAYGGNGKKEYYMYNYIDLLIVDEAGQISPEIAAPSFALAKKAVVVGDEEQIPPVWGTVRPLDIAMAIKSEVIEDKKQYEELEINGLNCSQSSIMKIAASSCAFNKYKKGLFLSEHRRCYNEIVAYCNQLVYEEKLDPKRGSFFEDSENALTGFLPAMGHKQITVSKSQKSGTSRCNKEEAMQIVIWLKCHYKTIVDHYNKKRTTGVNEKELVGIITPFKSQSILIKSMIKKEIPDHAQSIDVGTVHTFQGAERKVIIFSSVYGNEDGCFFINKAANLMNVAVSRAKDSFLVFGDIGCLTGNEKSASGLLKKMTKTVVE